MKSVKGVSIEDFKAEIKEQGWIRFDDVIDLNLIQQINTQLPDIYQKRRDVQEQNGIVDKTAGTIHHMLDRDTASMDFLSRMYLDDYIKEFFDGNYILNSFGGLFNLKNNVSYTGNIHRDVRSWTGDLKMMINMLVMLDDFTVENGATYVLTGSHKEDAKPEDEAFFAKADRVTGKRGSIVLFDSMLWHATGVNTTDDMRRALTLTFTPPRFKQQFDYPRHIGYDYAEQLSEDLLQVIGYNSRVPANLDEWYQPPHLRMYKPGQG